MTSSDSGGKWYVVRFSRGITKLVNFTSCTYFFSAYFVKRFGKND